MQRPLPELRSSIAAEQRDGKIDRDRARDIAKAVLEREVFTARERADVARIRALRSCAPPLYGALHRRAEVMDEIGAEAALILLEEGQLRHSPRLSHASAEDGAWRAVAARDTEPSGARGLRVAFFSDPDERVRRAALHAAVAAPDERDAEPLLEVSRVDPDPLARSLAIRALGHIGTERIVLALKDRWSSADEPLRLAIVDAWSMPLSLRAGGRTELVRLVDEGAGLPAIQAAHALLRVDSPPRELATQALLSAARGGSTAERRMALRLLPSDHPETLVELDEAAVDPDPEVVVLANARLLAVAAKRAAVREKLLHMAKGQGSAALQARAALAAAGEAEVTAALLEQLSDELSSHRRAAALGLLRLGRYQDAASIFADESPTVRSDVACQALGR